MTFEVTRPESYGTCMGCSIVADATARLNQYNTNEPDVALLEEFDGISKKTTHHPIPVSQSKAKLLIRLGAATQRIDSC